MSQDVFLIYRTLSRLLLPHSADFRSGCYPHLFYHTELAILDVLDKKLVLELKSTTKYIPRQSDVGVGENSNHVVRNYRYIIQ